MRSILGALVCGALFVTIAVAQESIGGGGSSSRNRGPDVPSLGLPVRVSGEVIRVDLERSAIQIRSKQRKQPVGFGIDPKCKIKADKKQFDKDVLKLEEIEAGFEVELTIRQADMRVIEMKVRKPKQSSSS